MTNGKRTGRTMSMPAGLAVGGVTSLTITLAGTAALAWLIHREVMAMENVGYGIMCLILAASFLGAVTAFRKIRRRRVLVCTGAGVVYLGILLAITALFFGGQYSAVGVTSLLVLCGSLCAGLLGLRQGRGVGRRKIKLSRR